VSIKSAVVSYEGAGLRFSALTGSGHRIVMDNKEGNAGARPAELVAVAQAGCTAMDVISILQKKRQEVTRYEVSIEAVQRDEPSPSIFTRSDVTHIVEGPAIDEEAVRRAIELSATKYCSVGATLAAGPVETHHLYRIIGPNGAKPIEGEVIVIGPHADVDKVAAGRPGVTAG
jgi:putative redox protein